MEIDVTTEKDEAIRRWGLNPRLPDMSPAPAIKVMVSAAEKDTQASSRDSTIAILFIGFSPQRRRVEAAFVVALNVPDEGTREMRNEAYCSLQNLSTHFR
jgi:hypothetical protein